MGRRPGVRQLSAPRRHLFLAKKKKKPKKNERMRMGSSMAIIAIWLPALDANVPCRDSIRCVGEGGQ